MTYYNSFVPPLVRTHLSLSRYARILGINPVHFWMGFGQTIWQIDPGCDDVWPRHSWQHTDSVSQEELALLIRDAEKELAKYLGYPLAPEWIAKEVHRYPRFYRPEYVDGGMHNTRGLLRGIETSWQKVTNVGRRATTAVATGVAVTYSDVDGDGFSETATVTTATSLTDVNEVHLYFAGTSGDPQWEVRDVRTKVISGGNVTFTLDSWLLIDPTERAAYPTNLGFDAIDIGDNTTHFVSTVDIYREYTDTTTVSAELYWEAEASPVSNIFLCSVCGGTGCTACTLTLQNGCIHVRDHQAGIVVPFPATYDSDSGAWQQSILSVCRTPDQVRLWYQAGDVSDDYLSGLSTEPLSDYWAQTIAMLATARTERQFCGCGNAGTLAHHWRTDIAYTGDDTSYLVDFGMLKNPFGTKIGEVLAFKRVSAFQNKQFDAALVG